MSNTPMKIAFDPAVVTIFVAISTLASSGLSERLRAIIKAVFRRPAHESTLIVHVAGTDEFAFTDSALPIRSENDLDTTHGDGDSGGRND